MAIFQVDASLHDMAIVHEKQRYLKNFMEGKYFTVSHLPKMKKKKK